MENVWEVTSSSEHAAPAEGLRVLKTLLSSVVWEVLGRKKESLLFHSLFFAERLLLKDGILILLPPASPAVQDLGRMESDSIIIAFA